MWDEIQEVEESEEKSNTQTPTDNITQSKNEESEKVFLPITASWYIIDFLFDVNKNLLTIGGHTIRKSAIQQVLQQMNERLTSLYQKQILKNENFSKSTSEIKVVQLLFDVQFLLSIFNSVMPPSTKKIWDDITTALENLMDAIDYEDYGKLIKTQVMRFYQRCSLQFGLILQVKKTSQYPTRPIRVLNEQINMLPIANTTQKFALLPIGSIQVTASSINKPQQQSMSPINFTTKNSLSPSDNKGLQRAASLSATNRTDSNLANLVTAAKKSTTGFSFPWSSKQT